MTVRELIRQLDTLDNKAKDMPVQIQYMVEDEDGESQSIVEEIDTVIGPQSWGKQKDRVTLLAWF